MTRALTREQTKVKRNTMKITVQLCVFYIFFFTITKCDDLTRNENNKKIKTYQLDVPGKEPITIIENTEENKSRQDKWDTIGIVEPDKDDVELKKIMTHIVHDVDGNKPRCYGPSCQNGYNSEDDERFDEYILTADKLKGYGDFPPDRLQAISALAAKLKKDKLKADRFSSMNNNNNDEEQNGKVYTTWNRLKVKQHKHPFDDKDGWVTLEPVAWSTSKISKWKPNVKKQKPNHWNEDEDRFPSNDRFPDSQESENSYSYTQKRPSQYRPSHYNTNKLNLPSEYDSEIPSRPTWSKPQQASYPSSWASDDGRRPHRPHCDNYGNYPDDDPVFYGMSDSVLTDNRPSNFPYDEYEALHQPQSSSLKRPFRKPTQVVYAGPSDYDRDSDRDSRPSNGDGQWVLLSTTKGYRNKKRQRSLNPPKQTDEQGDSLTMTSHQSVALTVLPVDKAHTNMTTSHGGLLEVEKSFQTVEESKRDMDKQNDLEVSASQYRPKRTKNRVFNKQVVANGSPDTSTLLAAVGAGMVPATMAMVVPMMLGKRRRRDLTRTSDNINLDHLIYHYSR